MSLSTTTKGEKMATMDRTVVAELVVVYQVQNTPEVTPFPFSKWNRIQFFSSTLFFHLCL